MNLTKRFYQWGGFNDNPFLENQYNPTDENDNQMLENLRSTVINLSDLCFDRCVLDFEGDLGFFEKKCINECVASRITSLEHFVLSDQSVQK